MTEISTAIDGERSLRLASDACGRLDAWLSGVLPDLSRRALKRAFSKGQIRMNGRRVRGSEPAQPGALVILQRGLREDKGEPFAPLVLAYEDPHLLVVEKAAGLPSATAGKIAGDSVATRLTLHYPELLTVGDLPLSGGLCHRLDTATSGLLLFARNARCFEALRAAFRAREITKLYQAVVRGQAPESGEIDRPLTRRSGRARRMVVVEQAPPPGATGVWPALTRFRRLEQGHHYALLELQILTGVTHQIRAHLAHLGLPVIGDDLYGQGEETRLALHASHLSFSHPADGERCEIWSSHAIEMRELFLDLERGATEGPPLGVPPKIHPESTPTPSIIST